jgi:hypothetical protein
VRPGWSYIRLSQCVCQLISSVRWSFLCRMRGCFCCVMRSLCLRRPPTLNSLSESRKGLICSSELFHDNSWSFLRQAISSRKKCSWHCQSRMISVVWISCRVSVKLSSRSSGCFLMFSANHRHQAKTLSILVRREVGDQILC